ncbi:MAG: glycosyltransferase family 4 protein [Dysgonamonadaceae bacterium]|nr:glycosyltransferase family 4 protein [Dysgonamonadaceae bacterium]
MMYCDGGCFQYAKELIVRLPMEKAVFMNSCKPEKHAIREFYPLKTFGFNRWERFFSLARFLIHVFFYGITGRYSGLLLFGPSAWDSFVTQAFAFSKKPIFYVVHDGEMHAGDGGNRTQNRLLKATRQASRLIFLSRKVKELVRSRFGIDKPSLILPHGLIDFGQVPTQVRRRKEKPVLLFLGRLSKYKGVDLLLEAIHKTDTSLFEKLIIAGAPVGNYMVLTNHPQVELRAEWLSEADMLQYLQEADILLFPYIEASQSGVATLAINYLLPSIVTRVGAFEEQFGDAALFIRPDAAELAEAIRLLCSDETIYNNLSKKALSLRRQYSWDKLAHDLTLFLQEKTESSQA